MDLRSVLNTSDNGERKRAQSSPTGPQQPQQPKQHPAHPQAAYGYHDHPQQSSPGKYPSQEYPPHQHPQYQGGNYPPQSPYQQPPPQQQKQHQPPPHHHQQQQQQHHQQHQHPASYAARPGPPPNSYHDPRSPPGPAPAPSPYRGPPSQSRESAGAYAFPAAQQQQQQQQQHQHQHQQPPPQELQSPTQRHQYPPSHYPQQRRDSHGQSTAPPPHPTTPYIKQQHQVPQTPPIATPGNNQPSYPHQRSQSTHSTPTPTSAHSVHQFGPPQHGSPAGPPPGQAEYNRHPSQPATPLGPPQQVSSRHSSYQQPASPYQSNKRPPSREPSTSQPSAPEPARGQTPVRPTPPSRGGQEVTMQDAPSHARILLDREPSMSVSPKTRVGSLPSNAERSDNEAKPARKSQTNADAERERSQRASTPAKRKLDDRSISPRELEHRHQRPPPGETNGRHESPTQRRQSSHGPPRKNRKPRAQPPVWALDSSTLGKKLPTHANFVLHERHAPANGHSGSVSHVKTEPDSQNGSPEVQKPQRGQSIAAAATAAPVPEPGPADILGAWEATITGVKPYEEVSKAVADFLFVNVVNGSDIQEIMSRGIKFEIEAKLGTLIDKDTNHRVDRNVASECILESSSRVAFRSSMTEVHHKAFNDFLNHVVIQADPRAPHGGNRVQVHYKHRRELDRFFELPPDMQNRIPGCMRARLGGRGRSIKVRVTHDQKTQEVIGKIIKARVADIDIHMPTSPMDCRISINLEMDWDGSVEELEQLASQGDKQPDRAKDRLSYTQGHYQVDLTQVTQTFAGPGSARTEKEHELEIELAPEILIDQGRKAMSGGVHRYQELVEGFVDNVRVLARKARDFQ